MPVVYRLIILISVIIIIMQWQNFNYQENILGEE